MGCGANVLKSSVLLSATLKASPTLQVWFMARIVTGKVVSKMAKSEGVGK